jgi:chlorophyll synthase
MNEVASPRGALLSSAGLAGAAVLVSTQLGLFFLACTLACIGLSVLYSHPSSHLKSRAGLDLLVNVLGIGIIIPLMGWSISGRPESEFPFLYLVPVGLALASLYAPTTVADYDADRSAGIGSLAVTLGKNATMWLSVAFLLSYIAANSVLAVMGYVVPYRAMLWLWPFQAAQVGVYVWFIRSHDRDSIVRGLAALSLMHTIGMGIFLLFYTGAIPL